MLFNENNTRPLTFGERQAFLAGADMDVEVVYVYCLGYRVPR